MHDSQPNYTILVNWGVGKTRGFGCSKSCDYCNWRGWDLIAVALMVGCL